MPDREFREAPDYTNAALTMLGVNLMWCFGLVWALPAYADEPVPPGPGVTIDVAGVEEPASPDPAANCTGTDPVTCATLREAIMFANANTGTKRVSCGVVSE